MLFDGFSLIKEAIRVARMYIFFFFFFFFLSPELNFLLMLLASLAPRIVLAKSWPKSSVECFLLSFALLQI